MKQLHNFLSKQTGKRILFYKLATEKKLIPIHKIIRNKSMSFVMMAICLLPLFGKAQFAPPDISNLSLWLDASDINNTGVSPANGSAISSWKDRSGNSRNAATIVGQSAGVLVTNQINGKSVIRFTRINDNTGTFYNVPGLDIRATANPIVTIFSVYKQGTQSPGGPQGVWGCDDGNWDRFFLSSWIAGSLNNGLASMGPAYSGTATNGSGIPGVINLLTAVYNHQVVNGSRIYFNGLLNATFTDQTDATAAQTSLRIGFDGDNSAFNGDIAEMIVYNRALSACEIRQVNQYLNIKYATGFASLTLSASGPLTFNLGGSVTLTASTTGTAYQWLKNGIAISGANSQSYTASTTGNFKAVVTTICNDTSAAAAVTVNFVLPVKLLSFNATDKVKNVLLKWSTTAEINSSFFVIERSTDVINFLEIGKVNANKTGSASINSYSFSDNTAVAAVYYYRLKMVDLDGATNYSKVERITRETTSLSVTMLPNPVGEVLKIKGLSGNPTTLQLLDVNGRILKQQETLSSETILNFSDRSSGIYYVRILEGTNVVTQKIIKNNK